LKVKGEKSIRIFLLFLAVLFSLNFVCALAIDVNLTSMPRFSNYSTIFNFSVTTTLVNGTSVSLNATLYCNYSGGAVTNNTGDRGIIKLATLTNGTHGNATSGQALTVLFNSSIRIKEIILPANESRIFNCSVLADNSSNRNWSHSYGVIGSVLNGTNLTFDSTPPNVSETLVGQVSYGNYTSTLVLNVSANDPVIGVNSAFFNITYSNGSQVNFSVATASGGYYSVSLDTTTFEDNHYNITIHINDTLNNLNNSVKVYSLAFDKTAPTGSISCSPSSNAHTDDVITCSCSATDPISGVKNTTFTEHPSTSSTGTFTQTCTAVDQSGNSGTFSTSILLNLVVVVALLQAVQ
jgi:hypothetical protein